MTKVERRKMLMRYRDSIKGKKFNPEDRDAYIELYKLLSDTGCLDYDYADHLRKGKFSESISDVENFSFIECCAYLTLIVRGERFESDWFGKCLDDGSIYKLMKRVVEVM